MRKRAAMPGAAAAMMLTDRRELLMSVTHACGLLVCVVSTATGATPYLGLEPGAATRADVAKTLGDPVLKLTDVLHEHQPQEGTGPIYVEYRRGGDVIDRIEVKLRKPVLRAAIVEAMKLGEATASALGSNGALVEYFGNGISVELTYSGAQRESGVATIRYDSDQRFNGELARAASGTTSRTGEAPPAPESPAAPGTDVVSLAPPSVTRNPAACYDVYLWADAQERVTRRAKQVKRRQMAMDVRIAAQSGDCDRARSLSDQYKRQFP